MPWPLSQDYNEAVQSPESSFADPDLCACQVATNALGMPIPCSGNFADVYRLTCPVTGRSWAVKCFTRNIPDLNERYRHIGFHLKKVDLPVMVDFAFLEKGIQVRGDWYPVLKMDWVEGFALNEYVRDGFKKPRSLTALSQVWLRLAKRLNEANLAHCDIQHGNILLVPGTQARSLALKLVDYDGMWVPALAGHNSGEVGHPAYQHPRRLAQHTYSLDVDRFPLLAIYCAIRSLMAGGRDLWDRYDTCDNLLFRAEDFRNPRDSRLFWELLQLNDPEVRWLTESLCKAAERPLEETPRLEELVSKMFNTSSLDQADDVSVQSEAGGNAPSSFSPPPVRSAWTAALRDPEIIRQELPDFFEPQPAVAERSPVPDNRDRSDQSPVAEEDLSLQAEPSLYQKQKWLILGLVLVLVGVVSLVLAIISPPPPPPPPPPSAASVTVSSFPKPSAPGELVTLRAIVTAKERTEVTPSGEISFKTDRGETLGKTTLDHGGQAVLRTPKLPVGLTTIIADYIGDDHFTATSSTAIHVVTAKPPPRKATLTSLSCFPNPCRTGNSVTLSARVMATARGENTPTGSVTFKTVRWTPFFGQKSSLP
jgi:serine/threonine protein kinase